MKGHIHIVAKQYESCQRYESMIYLPIVELHPMFLAWLFAQWRLDIVSPSTYEPSNKRFILVATNCFTKCIEVRALASITVKNIKRLIWEDIISRFCLPHTAISDNGKQFDTEEITTLYSAFGIKYNFFALYHPQGNGQVETTNKTLLSILKKWLKGTNKRWVKQLLVAL